MENVDVTQSVKLDVIIVDKTGALKCVNIKTYQESELYKKCGLKKPDGFDKQTEWGIKINGVKYIVSVYAKTEGRANNENKYDFPPPIDTILFYGSCAIVSTKINNEKKYIYNDLSLELWEKMYEKLFGGFEDLSATCLDDENEIDELANVPKEKKTKQGYLKDGFVVDSDADEGDEDEDSESISDEFSDDPNESSDNQVDEGDLVVEDVGSELSEEEYETCSDEE